MSLFNSSLRLKTGIVLNLLSLGFLFVSMTTKNPVGSKLALIITLVFALCVLLYTYYYSFVQTGLWKYTHKIVPKMDEREYADNNRALRFSYSVFTVTVLVFLMYCALRSIVPHILPVVSFIYFAHILPAVFLGWKR